MVSMELEKALTLYGNIKVDEKIVKRLTQNFRNGEKNGSMIERMEDEKLYIQNIEECRNQEDMFIEEVRKIEDEYIAEKKEMKVNNEDEGSIILNEIEE